ncbi:GNAT family N-acetyltransferase [Bacillus sp. Cs-700]|uniref:GNAT family N-acetyltransferase n=1 Tax=Bacillus sp. Cs-700 TaxID=2589818 RepID=UPI00140B725E|nr:GNAT family N-acetyltransferase [Bacillus sp. Cs-700]
MDIRKPNEVEIEKIIAFSPQAIFEGTLGEAEPTIEKAKQLVESLLKKGSYYLISTENDVITGWILLGGSKDQFSDKKLGFIYELFVIEECRGKGISKQLIRTGVEQLKQEGYSEIRLSVFDGNKAIKIYENLGFKNRTISMSISL